jgi:hypothetical protein
MKDGDVWNNGKRGEQEEVKSHFCCRKKQKKNTSSGSIKERFPHVTCQGAESANDLLMSKVGGSTNL